MFAIEELPAAEMTLKTTESHWRSRDSILKLTEHDIICEFLINDVSILPGFRVQQLGQKIANLSYPI